MTASKNIISKSVVILRQAQDDISFDKLRMTLRCHIEFIEA
ncbi:MAG: hypothetical protein WHV63_02315 [Ignavibacteria bacterium]